MWIASALSAALKLSRMTDVHPARPGLQLCGVHHIALIAADYARSKRFYTEVLGLAVVHEHYRLERQSWKLDLALPDGSQLELFSFPDSPPRPSRPEAQGLRHLALRVAQLDVARAHLAAHGVVLEPVRVDEFTGARFCFLADPDGLPIELVEPAAQAAVLEQGLRVTGTDR